MFSDGLFYQPSGQEGQLAPPFITRFAPSPTGYLHLGHAYSALRAFDAARRAGGTLVLRLEDIDTTRCRLDFETAILEDLEWLGLTWPEPVRRQSDHFADYQRMLNRLEARGLVYPCFCTRKEIAEEVARSPSAPHGPEGALYPGTCRALTPDQVAERLAAGIGHAWRLHLAEALATLGNETFFWTDEDDGPQQARPELLGDVVLARKDTPASYHLAVTHDDALQGISHVIRGRDLYHATHVHRLLQALMDWPVPHYQHHALIEGPDGRRLAKRDQSLTLAALRADGVTPAQIRHRLGLGPH